MQSQRIITLGRAADNTVALNESNVSNHHARLIIDGEDIYVEDLGSTNGTSVTRVEKKISRAQVKRDTTIFLGSTAYSVSDLLSRAEPGSPIPDAKQISEPSTESVEKKPESLIAAGLGGIALIALGWFVISKNNEEQQAASPAPAVSSSVATTSADNSAKQVGDSGLEAPHVAPIDLISQSPENLAPVDMISRSLFVIVCTDSQRKTPFRIGTGFAVDSEHVVTSAAVIEAISGLKENGYPDVFLYSPSTGDELMVKSTWMHSAYIAANSIAREAQLQHDAIFDELESHPPTPDAFDGVKSQLVSARSRAIEAMEQMTTCDVGVLDVDQALKVWLPAAGADASLRPNLKLQVAGYAFDVEDPFFDQSIPIQISMMPSRIWKLLKQTQPPTSRLLASGDATQQEYAYLGCPVMNEHGQVVAIYSRPTPTDDASESTTTFDAALFDRVTECLEGLSQQKTD